MRPRASLFVLRDTCLGHLNATKRQVPCAPGGQKEEPASSKLDHYQPSSDATHGGAPCRDACALFAVRNSPAPRAFGGRPRSAGAVGSILRRAPAVRGGVRARASSDRQRRAAKNRAACALCAVRNSPAPRAFGGRPQSAGAVGSILRRAPGVRGEPPQRRRRRRRLLSERRTAATRAATRVAAGERARMKQRRRVLSASASSRFAVTAVMAYAVHHRTSTAVNARSFSCSLCSMTSSARSRSSALYAGQRFRPSRLSGS